MIGSLFAFFHSTGANTHNFPARIAGSRFKASIFLSLFLSFSRLLEICILIARTANRFGVWMWERKSEEREKKAKREAKKAAAAATAMIDKANTRFNYNAQTKNTLTHDARRLNLS